MNRLVVRRPQLAAVSMRFGVYDRYNINTALAGPGSRKFQAYYYSTQDNKVVPDDPYEKEIFHKLESAFNPQALMVKDVSGGCGSMFAIKLVSKDFEGLSTIKQHRLVNEVLKDDISKWHGLQLQTKAKED